MIDLSVIIPVYNAADTIEKLLDTIPKRDNIEVIVVDDNSTKGISELEATMAKAGKVFPNFGFYRNDHGVQSAGACRNIGIEHATGRWLTFADGDDYYTDDFYEIVSKHFDDDMELIYFLQGSIDVSTGLEAKRHVLYNNTVNAYINNPGSRYNEMQTRFKCNSPVAKMVKRDVVKRNNIQFDEVIASNDELFSTKCGLYCKAMSAVPDVIYIITSRPNSLITNIGEERFWVRLEVFVRKYLFLKSNLSRRDFNLVDLSAQEKLFSIFQNGYSSAYKMKVIRYLVKNRVRFMTFRTINPVVFWGKIKLAFDLKNIRTVESKFLRK